MLQTGEVKSLEPVLKAVGISKTFGNFYALKDVNFEIYPGQVNVLIGENGAGKSTLLKILAGVYSKDEGKIFFNGHEVQIHTPSDANKLGIGTVYQELSLVPELSVAENMFLGKDMIMNKGLVSWQKLHEETRKVLKDVLNLDNVNTKERISQLGIAHQQMIEICRIVRKKPKILILDEPTAVLTDKEIKRLFEIIKKLKRENIAIVYISHRLEEIFEIGDRVTVFRDGRWVSNDLVKDINIDYLISKMVGRTLTEQYPKEDFSQMDKREKLRVENLCAGNKIHDVSLTVKTGEILGIAGLIGAGRTEIMRCIFGADKLTSGKIFLDGKEVHIKNTPQAVKKGIALLPEDRKGQGLVLNMSVEGNIASANLSGICGNTGLLNAKRESKVADEYVDKLKIALTSIKKPVRDLSGGNQQKVVIAKWMFVDPQIIIFDEPTRGIDVGSKVAVYNLINRFVLEGKAVVVISSEMLELMGICNRILTIKDGRVTGEFKAEEYKDGVFIEDDIMKGMVL